ncbi:MAG: cyclodeaminase/cyclohydrolase family protein [Oscillospiraceae bacterium]|nr:cyclodeaminase/cyclohydrolase family protein [Oscillospiraceae bacterium]
MAESKIKIELYRKMNAEDFTLALADPDRRAKFGSGAAMTAAVSAALLERSAALTAKTVQGNERLDYILRNAEIIRGYMVHLIDEDVKCHGPLRRATQEGDPQRIDAARETAVSIANELVNMMTKVLELLEELAELCVPEAAHFAAESAELAMGTMRSAMRYVIAMGMLSEDETYRFVTRRENEMTLEQYVPVYQHILEKTGA